MNKIGTGKFSLFYSMDFTVRRMVPFDIHLLHCKVTITCYFSESNMQVLYVKQIQDYLEYIRNAFPDMQPFSS